MDSLPNFLTNGDADQNPNLTAGLVALQQQDYHKAITEFDRVYQLELDPSLRLRAQIGLAIAYHQTEQIDKAMEICQKLSKNPNRQIRSWAARHLVLLSQGSSPPSGSISPSIPDSVDPLPSVTGFVPLENQSPKNQPNPVTPNSPPVNSTGFVPLNNLSPTNNSHPHSPNTFPSAAKKNVAPPHLDFSSQIPKSKQSNPTLPVWQNQGRAKKWPSLTKVKLTRLWWIQVFSAIALYETITLLIQFTAITINIILTKIPHFQPIQFFYYLYYQPTWIVITLMGLSAAISPWLIDLILKLFYGWQPLSLTTLKIHSPETAKLLPDFCRQRQLPIPTLGILPTTAPIAFSYGNLPTTARIVISQGLLTQLQDDEIAAIYAGELGHILNWDFFLMSMGLVMLQIPYTIYWQLAEWGNQLHPLLQPLFGFTSAVSYGIYWLVRMPMLWISRARIYWSDRIASDATGNPNGMTRALLKICIGIANEIQTQGKTSWLLEGFDLVTPVGNQQAITIGSLHNLTPWETVLAWDCFSNYQRWLAVNHSHPPLGDRLQLLGSYAKYWKLGTELNFDSSTDKLPALTGEKPQIQGKTKTSSPKKPRSSANLSQLPQPLQSQGAPFFGLCLGLAFGGLVWLVGWLSMLFRFRLLNWLFLDSSWLVAGFMLVGFSFGTILRINSFFPDLKPANLITDPSIPDLLSSTTALPINSQPLRLSGKLLGRTGISNWLGQDLILATPTGLVKLHWLTNFGPIGNLWSAKNRPSQVVGQSVTVTGWWRRGVSPWVDLETLKTTTGKNYLGGQQFWSTLIAIGTGLGGAYLICRGGLT